MGMLGTLLPVQIGVAGVGAGGLGRRVAFTPGT